MGGLLLCLLAGGRWRCPTLAGFRIAALALIGEVVGIVAFGFRIGVRIGLREVAANGFQASHHVLLHLGGDLRFGLGQIAALARIARQIVEERVVRPFLEMQQLHIAHHDG